MSTVRIPARRNPSKKQKAKTRLHKAWFDTYVAQGKPSGRFGGYKPIGPKIRKELELALAYAKKNGVTHREGNKIMFEAQDASDLVLAKSAPKKRKTRNPKRTYKPKTGYGFFYDGMTVDRGNTWKTSSDEDWDTEVLNRSDIAYAYYMGQRRIDGSPVRVWRTKNGYIAQVGTANPRKRKATKRKAPKKIPGKWFKMTIWTNEGHAKIVALAGYTKDVKAHAQKESRKHGVKAVELDGPFKTKPVK